VGRRPGCTRSLTTLAASLPTPVGAAAISGVAVVGNSNAITARTVTSTTVVVSRTTVRVRGHWNTVAARGW